MKLIIDIPEEIYKEIQVKFLNTKVNKISVTDRAIYNGTPLPKGHGRLIDADELYNSLEFPTQSFASAFKQVLDDAPTIIEADTPSCDTCKYQSAQFNPCNGCNDKSEYMPRADKE